MVKIKEAIVVEGRYDKNTLSQIVDAPIFETGGFRIFKDKEQLALLEQACKDEVSDMKDIVSRMVPTYKQKIEA